MGHQGAYLRRHPIHHQPLVQALDQRPHHRCGLPLLNTRFRVKLKARDRPTPVPFFLLRDSTTTRFPSGISGLHAARLAVAAQFPHHAAVLAQRLEGARSLPFEPIW